MIASSGPWVTGYQDFFRRRADQTACRDPVLHSCVSRQSRASRPHRSRRDAVVVPWAVCVAFNPTKWYAFSDDCSIVATFEDGEPEQMTDAEHVSQARARAAPADPGETPLARLESLGVRGILWRLAGDGQLVDVRCEMRQCYCSRGRRYFEPRSARSDWEPTADHYPRLKMHGGHLTPDNVRLAHRLCNRRDYEWRTRINVMLGKRMSLDEIAEQLNAKKVPTIHGTNRWTAASVRKAFVS